MNEDNTPEFVAYRLMQDIRKAAGCPDLSRKQILSLYAECLMTVRAPARRLGEGDKDDLQEGSMSSLGRLGHSAGGSAVTLVGVGQA